MNPVTFLLISVAVLAAVYVLVKAVLSLRLYLKFRGQRIITCPETLQPEAVDVAAVKAALHAAATGAPHLRLSNCSRWPERENCGQECLSQIEAAPEACLVRTIVTHWYAGKTCAYCHKPIPIIHWHEHRPALLDPEQRSVQWSQVPAEKLPEVFATYQPVCWDCHITESFRRKHPELVVERPAH